MDDGRVEDAVQAMRELVALAPGDPVLILPERSALSIRLRSEGVARELCDAFDALVLKRDWRRRSP